MYRAESLGASWFITVSKQLHADPIMSQSQLSLLAEVRYIQYHSSKETTYLSAIRQLISRDLSEPYSIYVYRYFLYQWGDLCFMVRFEMKSSR